MRPASPQVIEMGDRLAHREEALLQVELAAEQHRHDARAADSGASAAATASCELGEARVVMRAQLRDARGDAAERQAVRRQHQRRIGQRSKAASVNATT